MRAWRFRFHLIASLATACCLAVSPSPAQNTEFQKISLRFKDGRTETYTYGLPPFVVISGENVVVHFLKDKQVFPRNALRLVCHDACPENLAPVVQDTIVWDGRKPLETKGKVFSDSGFQYLQDGKVPVKNAGFDRVRFIQFGE